MNHEHNDIRKIVPYGEYIRGFANQKYLSSAELHGVLKSRGIFSLCAEKEFTVPLLQVLMLSPKEFDRIREAFSTSEDNEKIISRDVKWADGVQIYNTNTLSVEVADFIKKRLPTCTLEQAIRFVQVSNNPNHVQSKFVIRRKDINKSWYEQTNLFPASIEFINENGGVGRVIIKHTAPETKDLAEHIVNEQIVKYKKHGIIPVSEQLGKIIFKEFTNEERFNFFFRLTNRLGNDYFNFESIVDLSMKPAETTLPVEIKWMEDMNKIVFSGKSLDKKFFIEDAQYHKNLILWSIDASYTFNIKGQSGKYTINFCFPDFALGKGENAEFELNISSISTTKKIDSRQRKALKSELLSEMDKQKSIIFNDFIKERNKKNGH